MSDNIHNKIINNSRFSTSNRFQTFVDFVPLKPQEFRTLSENENIQRLPDDKLERLWLKPIQRMLQQTFRIDQRTYSTGTDPTLAELEEDFKVSAAITIDKFARNEDERIGEVDIEGLGKSKFDIMIPQRARQLLERYNRPGGRVGRA